MVAPRDVHSYILYFLPFSFLTHNILTATLDLPEVEKNDVFVLHMYK